MSVRSLQVVGLGDSEGEWFVCLFGVGGDGVGVRT